MTTLSGKNILLVGANGAFGREFCARLSQLGANVFGTASSNDTSSRLPIDLAQRLILNLESQQGIQVLVDYLLTSPEPLDGIILAAGLVAFGAISDTPSSVVERLMRVNALGQIQLVSQLVPKLASGSAAGREPFVLSISGVVAENPLSGLAAYSASKTALHGYALAASKELRKGGVRWLDARPGHTESGLAERAIFGTAPNFGAGMTVQHVVARTIAGIEAGEKDLPSSAY